METIIIEFKNLDRKTFIGNNISVISNEGFMDVKVDGILKMIISKDVIAFIECNISTVNMEQYHQFEKEHS